MYNGIGLTTARGSGTNGYIQTNKFFVKPKLGKVAADSGKAFDADQGTAGITRAPNRDILEHDRKRQIELKLVVLEDNLVDQGYTDAEIADRLAHARRTLETADDSAAPLAAGKKVLDTQTHQIAARKEKQMENLRAALGIRAVEHEEENANENDDDPRNSQKNDMNDGKHTKREHAFLDRGYGRKKHVEENQKSEKEDKLKNTKDSKRKKKEGSRRRKRHGDDSSDSDESAGKSRVLKKKHRKSSRRRSDDEDDDSDIGRKGKISKKHKRSKSARNDSESDSDSDSSSASSDYSDSASSYNSSDTDGSAQNLKAVKKKHKRTHKGSGEEEDNKYKAAQRHKINKRSVGDDTDSASSEDDSRKKSSRKQVETSKRYQRRHDKDEDSGSDGVLKAKKPMGPGRRNDSEDDSSSDSGMKKKNNRDVEEKKQNYKKSDRRPNDSDDDSESDKGPLKGKQHARTGRRHDSEDDPGSDGEMKAKNNQVEEERKQIFKKSDGMHDRKDDSSSEEGLWKSETVKEKRFVRTSKRHDLEDESDPDSGMKRRTGRDEEERKQRDSRRTRDEGFNNEDRKRSRFVGEERSKRKPDLDTKPDDEKFRKPESRTIERSRRSGKEDRGFDNSGGNSDDEKTEKPRGRRHDSSDEEPDSRYARNVSTQKPAEKRSDYGEKDLRTSTCDFEYRKNQQSKAVGESKSGDRDDLNRRARQRSPEDDFRSRRAAADEERRTERSGDGYPNKDVKKDSGSIRSGGRDDVAGERRDRSYRKDDEPHRGGRRPDRDLDQRGGDRWRMGSEEEHRGRKHGREEEEDDADNKYRGRRTRDEERDGRDSERDGQRDYSKRARYDDYSRSGERRRPDNERGDDRARLRD